MTVRRLLLLLAVPALLLAACGDDDGADDTAGGGDTETPAEDTPAEEVPEDLQPYADAIAADLESQDEGLGFTSEQYQCIGDRSAAVFGVERLEAVGTPEEVIEATGEDLTALEPTDDEVAEVVDAYFACVPDIGDTLREAFLAEETGETRECLEGVLTDELLRDVLEATLAADQSAQGQLIEELSVCESGA